MSTFVHLRAATRHSVGKSRVEAWAYAEAAAALEMPAIAVTDRHGVFAAVDLGIGARGSGIKPIIGAELLVQRRPLLARHGGPLDTVLLIAQTQRGFANLCRLSTLAWRDGYIARRPRVDMGLLQAHNEGLIALVGGPDSVAARRLVAGRELAAVAAIARLLDVFGAERLFLEAQHRGLEEDDAVVRRLVTLAQRTGVGLVATAPCTYARADAPDFWQPAGRHEGQARPRRGNSRRLQTQTGFATADVMARRFAEHPEALANTARVAEMVEADACPGRRPAHFPAPPSLRDQDADAHLAALATQGLARLKDAGRLGAGEGCETYGQRLERELKQIRAAGTANAFLTYAELAGRAREAGILVGPGSGMSAGSLVCMATGVATLDPLVHGLSFECLTQSDGNLLPLLALDVAADRRGDVAALLRDLFGPDRMVPVSRPPRAGSPRALLASALGRAPGDEVAGRGRPPGARPVEGPFGLVVCPGPAEDWLPLMRDEHGALVCQYDRDEVDYLGLWAVDLHESTPLSMIHTSLGCLASRQHEPRVAMEDLDRHDKAAYQRLSRGDTVGVFRIGQGANDAVRSWRFEGLHDLSALVAIARKGPLAAGVANAYVDRKLRRTEVRPAVEGAGHTLDETLGLIVYAEQVNALLAWAYGCDLAEADERRRRFVFTPAGAREAREQGFIDSLRGGRLQPDQARALCLALAADAPLAASKAHAVSVATLLHRLTWLFTHHPAEATFATLIWKEDATCWSSALIADAQGRGMTIWGPDVNCGHMEDRLLEGGIQMGMKRLRALRPGAAEAVCEARGRGAFSSLTDLVGRLPGEFATVHTMDVLAGAGALDRLVDRDGEGELTAVRAQATQFGRALVQERMRMDTGRPPRRQSERDGEPWSPDGVLNEEQRAMAGLMLSAHRLLRGQVQP